MEFNPLPETVNAAIKKGDIHAVREAVSGETDAKNKEALVGELRQVAADARMTIVEGVAGGDMESAKTATHLRDAATSGLAALENTSAK